MNAEVPSMYQPQGWIGLRFPRLLIRFGGGVCASICARVCAPVILSSSLVTVSSIADYQNLVSGGPDET